MSAPVQAVPGEGANEHLRNALMMLGGMQRALQIAGLDGEDAITLLEGVTRRVGLALEQVERPYPHDVEICGWCHEHATFRAEWLSVCCDAHAEPFDREPSDV